MIYTAILRCSCTLTIYPRQRVMVPFQFSGVGHLHFSRTAFTHFSLKVITLQVVISLKLNFPFDYSFTTQGVVDEDETGDGKRGITYEVTNASISTSCFHLFFFLYYLASSNTLHFIADFSEQGSYRQEEERTS